MRRAMILGILLGVLSLLVIACSTEDSNSTGSGSNTGFTMPSRPQNLETATVAEVIDGDTVLLTSGMRVRLIGLNTPEQDQPFYQEAADFLRRKVEGKTVGLEYDRERTDRFGRTLAYLWLDDEMVNALILLEGYANSLSVPPNQRYEQAFLVAQQVAQDAGRGLWKPGSKSLVIQYISYDAPGADNENLNGEWLRIFNEGAAAVDLEGYTLKDAVNNMYTFGALSLPPGQTVQLYTGCGQNTERELYWCADQPVWNNEGDVAVLRDAKGLFVADYQYSR